MPFINGYTLSFSLSLKPASPFSPESKNTLSPNASKMSTRVGMRLMSILMSDVSGKTDVTFASNSSMRSSSAALQKEIGYLPGEIALPRGAYRHVLLGKPCGHGDGS